METRNKNNLENGDVYIDNLRCAFRTVEVMGIITKNRVGSLEKYKLDEILTEAINVNLRILTSFFDIIKDKNEQQQIIKHISIQLNAYMDEKKQEISKDKLEREAMRIFWNLNFGAIFGIIIKTIRSIGSDKLQGIIDEICDKHNTPVHLLIKHGTSMWYNKNLRLEKILKDLKGIDISLTANEMLKYLIVHHCMLHNIDLNDKNKLQETFRISKKALLKIEAKR